MASLGTSWQLVSPLERLVPELMDMMLYEAALDLADLSRLSRTSRALYGQLLPRLLATEKLRNQAMRWALVKNLDGLVHKAVLHGAPASTIVITASTVAIRVWWTARGARIAGTGEEELTLGVAARHGSVGAFRRLVEVGARVDCLGVDNACLRALPWSIVHPASTAFLQIFLDGPGPRVADGPKIVTDTPSLVSQLSQHQLDQMLFNVVEMQNSKQSTWTASSCLDLAKRLLSAGANPNPNWIFLGESSSRPGPNRSHRGIFLPTLSAAVITRSAELVRLLLESGASVDALDQEFFSVVDRHGNYPRWDPITGGIYDPLGRRPALANHGPMFAVAYALAEGLSRNDSAAARAWEFRQLVDITNMCLARGAKIDVRQPMQEEWAMQYRTPLMLYLTAVRDWAPCRNTQPGSNAMQRLQYLVGAGASPAAIQEDIATERLPWIGISSAGDIFGSSMANRSDGPRDIPIERETSPAQVLLEAWCPHSSALPSLVRPLKLLLAPKGLQTDGIRPVDLLASYRYADAEQPHDALQSSDPVLSAWNSILTDVIQNLSPSDLNMLLADYIFLKATCDGRAHSETFDECCWTGDAADDGLTRPTIRRLLAAGADVDHMVGGEGGATAIQSVWFWLLRIRGRPGIQWDYDFPGPVGLTEPRARLLCFLIDECGADPATRCSGWTLPDILASDLEVVRDSVVRDSVDHTTEE
ncbi:hypothetical protein RB595_000401 [Gaeumannomyces hyphopodioides]